ncbi:ferrochelatase [soil metagenome]
MISARHEAVHSSLAARTAVLLVNLGTPTEPTASAVRRYLAEFLSDSRVVEIPRILWWPILHGIVLRVRPPLTAALYRKVWTPSGSPLLVNTRHQAEKLAQVLGDSATVEYAMRYGFPSIAEVLRRLRAAGMRHLLVLPLYPQYAGATTSSVFDAVAHELVRWRRVPAMRFVDSYHDAAGYIDALANSVRAHWAAHGRADRLLFSFHGLPARSVRQGDPYEAQCRETGQLLATELSLASGEWAIAFQSRFGREQWLQPYADLLLAEWAQAKVGRVQVLCPGFSADCLETLEEIAIRNRDDYVAAGGQALDYIPALNARDDHIAFLAELVKRNLHGWSGNSSS